MTVKESPDEPTLGADEVGTWKSYINVDHMAKERCGPLLGDVDLHAFYQALFQGIEGEDWGKRDDAYKDMGRAVVIKKPQGPKSKSRLENEGSQGCRRRILRSHV